jgi:hypothetical protein
MNDEGEATRQPENSSGRTVRGPAQGRPSRRASESVRWAAQMAGISTSFAYQLAREGRLPGVRRLGTRYIVSVAAFLRWLGDDP